MLNKYQNIFRSRWKAIWWALGILMTAYCTVPSADQTQAPQASAPPPPHQVNPWALDKTH
ncbi:MAG: hypothetical protein IE933_14290 [Sphingomonadales bacterium]|nr:hypothetical protein [Sphingomonadales bacterium]MBD3775222.1 hypothetical protein [Paracoccaceae bacterium]